MPSLTSGSKWVRELPSAEMRHTGRPNHSYIRRAKKVAFNFGYDQLDPLTTRKKPSVCDMRPADYIRLCKQVGVSGNMGAQLNYETGELTMWPNELQGKGLAVTFALPSVKPANAVGIFRRHL